MKSKLQSQADEVRVLKETSDALNLVYQAEATKLEEVSKQIRQLEEQRKELWVKISAIENDRTHANIRLSQHLDEMKKLCDANNPHRVGGYTDAECAKPRL